MGAVELVVAVGGHDQDRHRLHPAGEQPQDVQGRLVRPVHVLEDEHGRGRRPQLAGQRRHHRMRHRAPGHDRLQLAAGPLGDLQQRAEGARREQRIAGAPQDPRRLAALVAEPPHERGLADPCLAAHQQQLPASAALDGLQPVGQGRQLGGPLEQEPRRACAGNPSRDRWHNDPS